MIWVTGGLLAFGGFWLLLWYLQRQTLKRGQLEVANETQKGVIDDVEKANAVRDRMRADPDYARRVQDRFERKD